MLKSVLTFGGFFYLNLVDIVFLNPNTSIYSISKHFSSLYAFFNCKSKLSFKYFCISFIKLGRLEDFSALYPRVMQSYNISFDNYVGKIRDEEHKKQLRAEALVGRASVDADIIQKFADKVATNVGDFSLPKKKSSYVCSPAQDSRSTIIYT
jgi:hypothetical protein